MSLSCCDSSGFALARCNSRLRDLQRKTSHYVLLGHRPDRMAVSYYIYVASKGADPMLRKTMIALATAAALTGGLTADAFARGAGGGAGHGGGFSGGARMGGTFAGSRSMALHTGFRAPMIRPAIGRINGAPFAHFPRRRFVAPGWGDAPWYGYSGYDAPGYYYDPSTIASDEQLTYPAPIVTPPPAPNAKVVLNPYSKVTSEDLLRPGELLLRFPPPKKISR
jgi:hypothetical protein